MKVHEIMTAHARCVSPDNNLVEAAGLMREMDVGALPVCENDRIAGMVTDRDIVLRATADGRDPNTTSVRDVMTEGVVYVFADQEVEEAARIMKEREIRRLPVLNREKRLVGALSLGDLATSSNPAFSGMTLREVSQPKDMDARDRKREALGRAATGERRRTDQGQGSDGMTEENSNGTTRGRGRNGSTSGTSTRSRSKAGTRQPRQRKATSSRTRGAGKGSTKARQASSAKKSSRKRTARAAR
jgi:CBS domain-containing protein